MGMSDKNQVKNNIFRLLVRLKDRSFADNESKRKAGLNKPAF
jgi:hypothetical protein